MADMKLVRRLSPGVGARVDTPRLGDGLGSGFEDVLPDETEDRCDVDGLLGVKYSPGEASTSD